MSLPKITPPHRPNVSAATGTLPVANGGTGATTASAALTALGITFGTYTPTLANSANVGSSTPSVTNYRREGNTVTVFGTVSVTPTAAVPTQLRMTLPVASNLAQQYDLGGAGASQVGTGMAISPDVTNDAAYFTWTAPSTDAAAIWFSFSYVVQ